MNPRPAAEVEADVESAAIDAPAPAPAGDAEAPAAEAPAGEPVSVEVEGIVDDGGAEAAAAAQEIGVAAAQADAGPQLALTGASEVWKLFVMLSITLMAAGIVCMRWGRLI